MASRTARSKSWLMPCATAYASHRKPRIAAAATDTSRTGFARGRPTQTTVLGRQARERVCRSARHSRQGLPAPLAGAHERVHQRAGGLHLGLEEHTSELQSPYVISY